MKNNIKKIIINSIPIIVIFILAFLFSMNCSNTLWYKGPTKTDSSVFIYIARTILNGQMPYLNVFDHKGPLIYIYNVIGLLISEWKGIYLVELISLFVAFGFMYKTARLKCNKWVSLLVLIVTSSLLFIYFEGGNLTEEYALPFLAISMYVFTDYFLNDKINKFRIIACGFSFGAVCMLRPNMLLLWVIMSIGALIKEIKAKKIKELFKFILMFVIGALIIILPIMIWLISKGAFKDFINDYILFNLKYSVIADKNLLMASRVYVFNHFLNKPLVLITLVYSLYICFSKKHRSFYNTLFMIALVVNLLSIAMSGRNYSHYGMIMIPMYIYPISLLFKNLIDDMKKNEIVSLVIIIYLLVSFGIPNYLDSINKAFLDYANRNNNTALDEYKPITNIILKNSKKGDKITVTGIYNIYYNLTNRYSASKYSYVSSDILYTKEKPNDRYDEFYKDLEKNKPKLIITKNDYFDKEGINKFVKENNYKKIYDNSIIIYKRRK